MTQFPATRRHDYLKGVLAILAATVLWALSGVFVRLMTIQDPWLINGYRALSMTAAVLIYLLAIYGRQTWGRFAALDRHALAFVAMFYALGTTCYIVAVSNTLVANVACLTATAPIFAAVLARLLLGERSGPAVWLATGLALVGIYVIFREQIGLGDWVGNLVAIGAAFCFAGQTVTLRRYRSVDALPAICIGGAVVCIVMLLARGAQPVLPKDLLLILAMGVVQLAIPVILFVRGARHVPAVQIALISLLDVLFNPLFAWMGAGEAPSTSAIAGGGIIVAGVLLMVLIAGRGPAAGVQVTLSGVVSSRRR